MSLYQSIESPKYRLAVYLAEQGLTPQEVVGIKTDDITLKGLKVGAKVIPLNDDIIKTLGIYCAKGLCNC